MTDPQEFLDALPGSMSLADFANLALGCLDQCGMAACRQAELADQLADDLGLDRNLDPYAAGEGVWFIEVEGT